MQDLTQLPGIPAAGVDVGATKTHFRFVAPGAVEPSGLTLRTADFGSVDELITAAFVQTGCMPKRVVAAVAGRAERNGDIRVTNLKEWPVFHSRAFADKHGIEFRLINDLYAQLAGIGSLDSTGFVPLTPELPAAETLSKVIVAPGSGIGGAFMTPSGHIHPTEMGHLSWQPVNDLEIDLLREVFKQNPGVVATLEGTVSGLWGWDFLYNFVAPRVAPGPMVLKQIDELRSRNEPVGPAISVGAIEDDPCCLQIMELYGSLFGQFLRNITLTTLVEEGGAIYLSGSVMQANNGAMTLAEKTSFFERYVSRGAEFSDFLSTIPFYLVTDGHVAVKGAYELAANS